MKRKYETLDEYLDDLDAIKEKVAEKTSGMTTEETWHTSLALSGACSS